ncbi:hypothetical protein O181_029365 [Austropuccinia psidii MF-1]|uniref:Ribosome biogenesis protein NOP53 n=1 Tax=Austropuccinia psidii MF-1 TaxID=1389203 RepID=A0A9Q3CV35_9BASI|nr:hypothetical protein [Austropuccinia psidii MF-1]
MISVNQRHMCRPEVIRRSGCRHFRVGCDPSFCPPCHGPPPLTGRARPATTEQSKLKLLTLGEKKRLEKIVIRKGRQTGLNSIDPEKRHGTLAALKPPTLPTGDIWQSDSLASCAASEALPPVKAPRGLRKSETENLVLDQIPAVGLVPVPIPHPGQSYNPTLEDHQKILRTTLEKLEEEKFEEDRLAEVQKRVNAGLDRTKSKTQWEICEEEVGDGESHGEEDQGQNKSEELPIKKKAPKKKTTAQRNRRARAQEELRALSRKKEAKRMAHSLLQLPKIMKDLTAAEVAAKQAKLERKARRAGLVGKYGISAKRGGQPKGLKSIQDQHEYQLTEDLTEAGLRGLKPEGNLWRDWSQSNIRRGRLESRPKIGLVKGQKFEKGRKFKEVEKHAWKNFEA